MSLDSHRLAVLVEHRHRRDARVDAARRPHLAGRGEDVIVLRHAGVEVVERDGRRDRRLLRLLPYPVNLALASSTALLDVPVRGLGIRFKRLDEIVILNPAVDAGHGGNLRPGLQP